MPETPQPPTTHSKFLPRLQVDAHFTPRHRMLSRFTLQKFQRASVPVTKLPVDCTGGATVQCPMDGNDRLGICMEAMAEHVDNIWTYRQGKGVQSVFDQTLAEAQYKAASGGDNGLDEVTLLNQCWKPGLAGQPAATYVDSLDIDLTNVPLVQYAIDQFYHVCMMWSVPDNFIAGFDTGTVWPSALIPDPNNGHGTPLSDVFGPNDMLGGLNLNGFYRLFSWGTWCAVSPAFIASVQPAGFIVFSARQFDPATGLDSKGRHISQQAAVWHNGGGNVIPGSVIAAFPPAGPTPTPSPVPPGPTPTPTPPPPPVTPPLFAFSVPRAIPKGVRFFLRAPVALPVGNYDVTAHAGRLAEMREQDLEGAEAEENL